MLTARTLAAAIDEAERFVKTAQALERSFVEAEIAAGCDPGEDVPIVAFPVQSGAVRRASMDLSRALSVMRARPSRSKT